MENVSSNSLPSKSKVKRKPPEDLQAIQADVASFAASLGLAAAAAGTTPGFDDSDFRKKGPIRKGGNLEGRSRPRLEVGPGEEKKKRKRHVAEGVAGNGTRVNVLAESSRALEALEDVFDKPVPRSGKRKKEQGSRLHLSESINDVRKGPQTDLVRSRIHEVLDGATGGAGFPNNAKWKGNSNYRRNEENESEGEPQNQSVMDTGRPYESDSVQKMRIEAQQLMEKAAEEYERLQKKDSDAHWLMTARRSGTSADKVAAMTVILQDNPKANVRTLDALIGMLTSKAGKRHAATGIDALKELFIFSLLPDRKLKYFSQQPVASLSETKERAPKLLEWYWEDCLKHRYERFVLALEEATKDTLLFLKEKALKTVYELLKSKPEQERRLLSALVNKLGDPNRKVASDASYLLSCLLTAHPNMKKVVVDEVDAFVFRPHVGLRARYYAAVFLNQIVLNNKGDGSKLAKQLIDLYFSLFKAVTCVAEEEDQGKKKNQDVARRKGFGKVKHEQHSSDFVMEIDSRLLSALLTGVNRALPYIAADDLDSVTQENSVLFRLVHSRNFNVAVQALMLLHQLLTRSQAVSDRFYRALYSVLLSEGLVKSTKAEMFLGLMFKALKSDIDPRRMSAFTKRLTQVAIHQPPQFACGCLLLLSEILKARPSLWNLILQPEDNDEDVEHFEDVKEDTDSKTAEDDNNGGARPTGSREDVSLKKGSYDPRHRDPLYCNAHRACWWELTLLACHAHPSVATMARTLLSGASILYNGDPLRDLALGIFLDRFAEKKPKAQKSKQAATWHGSSLTMPMKLAGAPSLRPSGEQFSSLAADEVAPEDVVFHKFYVSKSAKTKPKKKRKDQDEDDITGMAEVFEGDDSEDEEVDALLEQDADLEMVAGDDNDEGEIDSDEEILLHEGDDHGDEDGSEIEAFDDSGDEEADALLEAGLAMSSDEDERQGSQHGNLGFLLRKKMREPNVFENFGKSGSVFQEAGSDREDVGSIPETEEIQHERKQSRKPLIVRQESSRELGGARGLVSKRKSKTTARKIVRKESGVFEDEDVATDKVSKRQGKSTVRRKPSVFQEMEVDGNVAVEHGGPMGRVSKKKCKTKAKSKPR